MATKVGTFGDLQKLLEQGKDGDVIPICELKKVERWGCDGSCAAVKLKAGPTIMINGEAVILDKKSTMWIDEDPTRVDRRGEAFTFAGRILHVGKVKRFDFTNPTFVAQSEGKISLGNKGLPNGGQVVFDHSCDKFSAHPSVKVAVVAQVGKKLFIRDQRKIFESQKPIGPWGSIPLGVIIEDRDKGQLAVVICKP